MSAGILLYTGLVELLSAVRDAGVDRFVFSSSAATYGMRSPSSNGRPTIMNGMGEILAIITARKPCLSRRRSNLLERPPARRIPAARPSHRLRA